jgi:hypothetical protein
MKTIKLTVWAMLLLLAVSLGAHHSYGALYDLRQTVILKGKVAKVAFKEPHVILSIETKGSGVWDAEWTSMMGLLRRGIDANTIRVGDILEIEGSPARNPDSRVVSALRDIKRPADGWNWKTEDVWPGPRVIE